MKILLVNSPFRGGGITAFATELSKCLSQDHELTVVLKDDSLRPIKIPGVKVLHYDTKELSQKNARFFIKLINEDLKPDLVISSCGLITSIIAPYLDDQIRVITVSHSGRYFNSDNCALNHKYIDNIIAASSDYNKKYLERKFHIRDKNKTKVIYNFMASNPELENFRFLKKDNQPIRIVFSGGSLAVKRADLVLKILCLLVKTDLNFKFYWTGGTFFLPQKIGIFRHIKPNNIKQFFKEDERIAFVGKIPSKKEFDELIASANVMLMPSFNEGCSMLLLESLRTGAICVVGDYLHSNREIVEKGECGFVLNHRSPEDFVNLLTDIISNREKYYHYYENSYNTYKNLLSYPIWKASLDKILVGKLNHKHRKQKISKVRICFDILKMKMLREQSEIQRFFQYELKSYFSYCFQFLHMKLKGEFPASKKQN